MKISPRLALVIIASLFALPLVLAWLMYSGTIEYLSLIHISEPTRPILVSRMPSSA